MSDGGNTKNSEQRLMDALHGAIGGHSRSFLARVTNIVAIDSGRIQAHQEQLGNVNVLAATTDRLAVGDWIRIQRSGPNKYDPFIYQGFAASTDGTKRAGVGENTPIHVTPPVSDGSSTAASGTLQYYLDKITKVIGDMKGTTWETTVNQSLSQAINWRLPVTDASSLPSVGNRIGDVRLVITTETLYVWTSGGWHSLNGAGSSNAMAVMSAASGGIGSFMLAARTASGIVLADATELTHIGNVVGVTTESAGGFADTLVQLSGVIQFPTAVFGSYRGPMMVGSGGAFSSTVPGGAKFVQQAGVVVSSDELHLNLDTTIITL